MTRNLSISSRVSTLALAVALVVGPTPAAAQSFQGSGSFTNPSHGSIDNGVPNITTVTVNQAQSVINWTPTDNAVGNFGGINFQPQGTTAIFQNNVDLVGDFAVLNRINVADNTRVVALNGTINSLVNGQTGGAVYFYSPSGFVVGSNAIINVGSLVLSASPISFDPDTGSFITPANGGSVVTFGQAENPNAQVNIVAGSQISALNEGSYVAVVAPRVTHEGTISVNGGAALVGAEAATLTFRTSGLFDIQVDVGTTDANGVGVNGTITGPASSGPGDYHRAYLVAVPKNTALTLAMGGGANLGFEIAGAADVVGNAVVLSAGHDIFFGDTSSGPSSASGADANISIAFVDFTSALYARANGIVTAGAVGGALNFASDVSLRGRDLVLMEAGTGGSISVGGNLTMSANRTGSTEGESVTAGNVALEAWGGGMLSVTGNTALTAIGTGGFSDTPGLATGDGTGGNIFIQATTGGDLSLGGSLNADATGSGGSFVGDIDGGDGFGGTVNVFASGGGTLSVTGGTYLTADGEAGFPIECIGCGGIGGIGDAGTVNVQAHSGPESSIDLGDVLYIWANGYGGNAQTGAGGTGLGGNVNLSASDQSSVAVAGDVAIQAEGYGGDAFGAGDSGGLGQGGFIQTFASNGGTFGAAAGLSESANGFGGDSETGTGGLGRGGTAGIAAFDTAASSIDLTGLVVVSADGEGGTGANGGTGTGGIAYISAILGTIHAFGNVVVTANSDGGDANSAGGTGGSGLADIESTITPEMTEAALFVSGGSLTVDGLATVSGNATGGNGGFNGGNGGNAVAAGVPGVTDGGAVIHAANSDNGASIIRLANVVVTANAQGGQGSDGQGGTNGSDGGNGGSATGGKAVITAAAGSGDIIAGATQLSASATGGSGGSGGSGDGGDGGNGGEGGSATGGFINVGSESGNTNFAQGANNGVASYTSITAVASATAGDGGDGGFGTIAGIGGNGGDAFGGNSVLLVRGSDVTVGGVNLDASAFGGDGGLSPNAPDGDGGDATAGTIGVVVTNRFNLPNQRATLTAGNITGTAVATGGTGGTGNGLSLAVGGNQFVVRRSDATINSVSLVTTADAFDGLSLSASSSPIEIQNGTVNITGQFIFQTPGEVSMWNDGGTLNAAQINVAADNFIHDEFLSAPVTLGTFAANNIFLTTDQDLVVDGHLVSLNGVGYTAPGLIDVDNVTSTNGPLALTAGETIDAANLTAGQLVAVNGGGDVSVGNINAATQQAIVTSTSGSIVTGTINAGSFIGLDAQLGDIATGNLDAGTLVSAQANGGAMTLGTIDAGSSVQLFASGNIAAGAINAGTFVAIESSGGAISLADITSPDIDLDALGPVAFGNVLADSFDFDSGDDVMGGDIVVATEVKGDAGGTVVLGDISAGIQVTGGPADSGIAVGIAAQGSISVGDVEADEAIGFATFGDLDTGALNSGSYVLTLVGGDTTIASITTPDNGLVYHGDAQMFIDAGGPDNFDPSLVFNSAPLQSGGSYNVVGTISTGDVQAAAAAIGTGDIFALGAVTLDAAGSITTGDIDAATIDLLAGADIGTGDLTAQGNLLLLFPGASVTLDAGGDISTGAIASVDGVYANAGGGISTGQIDAGDFVLLLAGADIITGPINAFGYIEMLSGGGITTEELDSGEYIDLLAGGDIAIAAAIAAQYFDVESTGGGITAGDITAGDAIEVAAGGGNIDLGNLSAGIVNPAPEGAYHVAVVAANGSVTVGSASALDDVYMVASGNLVSGDVDTGGRFLGLAGGDMSFGAITTGALGQVLLGDYSMAALGGDISTDGYDVEAVFNASPTPTGGSITIGGPVSTGLFQAAAGTGLTAGGIDATTIEASAGGTATLNGIWSAQDVALTSSDIDITAGGGISGSASGLVSLISTNATQALIGDGLTGSGYALSNAEFGRIEGGSVYILARGDASAAQDMLIGDLTVTGPAAGSTIENSEGILVFATGDVETQIPGGVIRVVGDVTATGFEPSNAMEFYADLFELDAATGSIAITSSGTTLGGELGLYANQIHVAQGSILDQLAIDPQYAGYQQDLNAPAAVQRPEGVLNAGVIWIESDNLQNVLIQNTGTAEIPAGFLANQIFLNEDFDVAGPPGSIDVVVNGQLVTEAGTLTGVAVRDALVAGADLSPFTANSTINNCLLAGACGTVEPPEEPPVPPSFQPSPGIQQEIVLAEDNLLPPPEFGNEDFIDDNDEETEEGETSPITPPDPLFDTSELGEEADAVAPEVGTSMRSSPGLTYPGDVDDPVSGSGNPGLMETPAGPPSSEEKQQ